MYLCDRCGFETDGLNTYLAHACCRMDDCNFTTSKIDDLHAHYAAEHRDELIEQGRAMARHLHARNWHPAFDMLDGPTAEGFVDEWRKLTGEVLVK